MPLNIHPHLVPRLNNEWIYTSTPILNSHGLSWGKFLPLSPFTVREWRYFSLLFMVNALSYTWNRRRIKRYWCDPMYWCVRQAQWRSALSERYSSVLKASQLPLGHFVTPVSCSACRVTLQINEWHRVEQIPQAAEARTRPHEGGTYCCNIIVMLRDIWEISLPLACLIDFWHCQLQIV